MSLGEDAKRLAQAFLELPQPDDIVQCEYVWIDGSLRNFRTKSKTWRTKSFSLKDLPVMEFCGSATDFDVGNLADYYAKPVTAFQDPFRPGKNKLVFCETYSRDRIPTFANNRFRLMSTEQDFESQGGKYEFLQPYKLFRADGRPLSYMNPAYDRDSIAHFSCGREIAEAHYKACLYAGVMVASLEPSDNNAQWQYSIGPTSCVHLGDHVWMSRFILLRVAEDFGVTVSFDTVTSGAIPLTSTLRMHVDGLPEEHRQWVSASLSVKLMVHDQKLAEVRSSPDKITIPELHSDIDPYHLCYLVIVCMR